MSGGIGGARMARGLAQAVEPSRLTIIVNVGDDDVMYGVHVAADLDTVTYTLAGIEGPHGWGIDGDRFTVMDHLSSLGVDTSFRLGDRDLATCLHRTSMLDGGSPLSAATASIAAGLGVRPTVLPASDERIATRIQVADGSWLDFQEYFVLRRHRDDVIALEYSGAADATPAPGVLEAIDAADVVVIAPSNPPLSIWPILAIPGIREALQTVRRVIAVSPLIGGKAIKGPADRVLSALGCSPGNLGILEAYQGLLTHLVVHVTDADDVPGLAGTVAIVATDTLIKAPDAALRLAEHVLGLA